MIFWERNWMDWSDRNACLACTLAQSSGNLTPSSASYNPKYLWQLVGYSQAVGQGHLSTFRSLWEISKNKPPFTTIMLVWSWSFFTFLSPPGLSEVARRADVILRSHRGLSALSVHMILTIWNPHLVLILSFPFLLQLFILFLFLFG